MPQTSEPAPTTRPSQNYAHSPIGLTRIRPPTCSPHRCPLAAGAHRACVPAPANVMVRAQPADVAGCASSGVHCRGARADICAALAVPWPSDALAPTGGRARSGNGRGRGERARDLEIGEILQLFPDTYHTTSQRSWLELEGAGLGGDMSPFVIRDSHLLYPSIPLPPSTSMVPPATSRSRDSSLPLPASQRLISSRSTYHKPACPKSDKDHRQPLLGSRCPPARRAPAAETFHRGLDCVAQAGRYVMGTPRLPPGVSTFKPPIPLRSQSNVPRSPSSAYPSMPRIRPHGVVALDSGTRYEYTLHPLCPTMDPVSARRFASPKRNGPALSDRPA
ncbi:hypothetical protein C8R44DRAFT_884909 [Mycena epipterygia]|nr:hypothetical protein C8R44DRAFT_884909 [Mycena epipterygia]